MAGQPRFADCVFINCPFDNDYWPIFEAIVFCVIDCGFVPRCALEEIDSGEIRLDKIRRIIEASRFGVHDLSRVEIAEETALPRFNMPFELGLDLGCRFFAREPRLRRKKCLILESERYRYQAFLSDIAGQDVKSHDGSPYTAIKIVRDWLRTSSRRKNVPGPAAIKKRFAGFTEKLPELCEASDLDRNDIQFVEYVTFAEEWIDVAR